jgi:hypothetical protein
LSKTDSADQRLQAYLTHLPQAQGEIMTGRNILPYESTAEFVMHVSQWIKVVLDDRKEPVVKD